MKKSNKKESASMSELLGILSYSERDTCFHLEGGGCLDIVRVICSDFQAIRDIDLEYENLKLQQFYSRYPADLKLVCRNGVRSRFNMSLTSWSPARRPFVGMSW